MTDQQGLAAEENGMSYEDALQIASRDDRFKATVYAMNSLLIHKGVYTQQEFEQLFVEWVAKEQRKTTFEPQASLKANAWRA